MIAKGSSRSGPKQLAVYLMRVGRYDTGEPTELLELQSPWAAAPNGTRERTAANLAEAFRDWQTLCEGTKQGEYGLYHAQISPAPKYAQTMTPEQWKRAADLLGEELGLHDQPRAVVLHAGKDGRHHLHVVWSRTDIDVMKLHSDSHNYQAHERASHRMELEFGQDFVPGKHAKRDREQQPEFPREKLSQDEAQQAERLGMTKAERIAQIAAIRKPCDDGLAFKNALEEAGYVLAKGDRGIILVDQQGEIFSLTKYLPDLKGKPYKSFMAPVDQATLPSVEEARAIQDKRQATVKSEAFADAQKQVPEASKFLPPDLAQQIERPAPAPAEAQKQAEVSKFLPPDLVNKTEPPATPEKAHDDPKRPEVQPAPSIEEKPRTDPETEQARKDQITSLRVWSDSAEAFKKALEEAGYILAAGKKGYCLVTGDDVFSLVRHAGLSKYQLDAFMSPIPLDSLPTVDEAFKGQRTKDPARKVEPSWAPELEELMQALAARQKEEARKLAELHAHQLRLEERNLDRENADKMKLFRQMEDEQREAFTQSRQQYRTGIQAIIDVIQSRWNPTLAAEKAKAREKEREQFYRRLARERVDYENLITQTKQLIIEGLIEKQRGEIAALDGKGQAEQERNMRDFHEARRIQAELEAKRIHEKLEKDNDLRDGPPPPRRGK